MYPEFGMCIQTLFDYQGKIHMMKKNGAGFAARVQKQDQTLVPPFRTNRLVTSSTKFEAVVSSTKKLNLQTLK